MDAAIVDTSIFKAFPNAIIHGVWSIGTCKHGSVVGNIFEKIGDLDVIVDEGQGSSVNTTPETINSDFLVYAYPAQMPTLSASKLVSNYMLYNKCEDDYYQIVDAGIGKNQHTGNLEHIELKLLKTEVVDG